MYLANTLQSNKVISFLYRFPLHSLFPNQQTVATLDLGLNQIGDHGTQYLSNALQRNQVILLLLLLLLCVDLCIQTLRILNLQLNQIGPQGAAHLADGLQQNQVTAIPAL